MIRTTITSIASLATCAAVLMTGAGCGVKTDGVLMMGDLTSAVADDRVQPLGFKVVDYPTFEELVQGFERAHQQSEKIYNGDGSWGEGYGKRFDPPVYHPLMRDTARRVLGYIDAHLATGEAVYKQRAREGLEYLLKEQRPDGQFVAWVLKRKSRPDGQLIAWIGDPKKGTVGGGGSLYVTAIPSAAFIEGYKLFNDRRYLEASNKACDYICTIPVAARGKHPHIFVNTNANLNLFASWALALNYEVTKNEFYLDRAQCFAWSVIYKQLPSGMWSDEHNQAIGYQGKILRGMVTLLSVMPEDDPHRIKIQKATYKALNHIRARRQTADGGLIAKPDSKTVGWCGSSARAIAMCAMRLNWSVADSVHLTAKGVLKYGSTQKSGNLIMAIGSLMRAYKQAERITKEAPSKAGGP